MKDGKILMNEKSETLYLPSIDRHLNMKTISCRAENEAGFSEKKELMLTVKCKCYEDFLSKVLEVKRFIYKVEKICI